MLYVNRQKFIAGILLSLITLFLISCQELGGEKPLTPVRKSFIDTNVTGIWKYAGCTNYNHFNVTTENHYLYIASFNAHEYLLYIFTPDDTAKNVLQNLFRATVSCLKGKTIANVQPILGKVSNEFVYYPYKYDNDTLFFWGFYIDKVPETVTKHQQYKSFILKYYNDTSYYSSCRKYVRYKKTISFF